MNRYIRHILKEEIFRVLKEDETLDVSDASEVGSAINDSSAESDENGSKKFNTSVSNLSNNQDKGDTLSVKASNSANAQSQIQGMKSKYPDFFNRPTNNISVDVNPKYR